MYLARTFVDGVAMNASAQRRVGRYRLGAVIGYGGIATVSLGQLEGPGGFRKLVALKQLNAEPALSVVLAQEARLNSAISHPNVVSILDVLEHDGELTLVMDYVNGETVAGILRQARKQGTVLPVGVVCRILNDVLHGLHAVHTATSVDGSPRWVVHRDVSPLNIMVGVDGIARVMNFGLGKAALGARHTASQLKGKLAYMAPEQVREQPVDARTDVFAVGVVLWEALSGRRLFVGGTALEVMSSVLSNPISPMGEQRKEIGPALEQLVQEALARAPAKRFASALAFADALEATGKLASRAEVAAWVQRMAGAALERRNRLCSELDAGTARAPITPVRLASRASSLPWRRAARCGALLAAGGAMLATAVACPLFAPRGQTPTLSANTTSKVLEGAARPLHGQASSVSAVLATAPCAALPASGPPNLPVGPALVTPPLRPESLPLETSPRVRHSKIGVRGSGTPPARTPIDVLGF